MEANKGDDISAGDVVAQHFVKIVLSIVIFSQAFQWVKIPMNEDSNVNKKAREACINLYNAIVEQSSIRPKKKEQGHR